jgi:molecular chaperone DnaK
MSTDHSLAPFAPATGSVTSPGVPLRAIGIDLGTTNSTVAEIEWRPGGPAVQPRCVEIDQETREGTYTHVLVPSVVATHEGSVLVGEGAKRLRSRTGELGLRQNRDVFFDCKNDIGLSRTYHMAPEGLRTATEVAAKILTFLRHATEADSAATPPSRVVVTVPASFQAAQRRETLEAARSAGLTLGPGDLLDEPIAAFLDELVRRQGRPFEGLAGTRHLLVFDFGGGTCDIAVFALQVQQDGSSAEVSPLSVSRYHRLGGGDIDAAIVHEVLIPQVIAQNALSPFDLTFEHKKQVLEPALLGTAEALKIGLCSEIRRLASFKKYDAANKKPIEKIQPGLQTMRLGSREFVLQSPRLTAAEFDDVLRPFLDKDLLYHIDGEYRSSCSIFAPLSDAIDRANLQAEDIDICLVVGGSSLIPQVSAALQAYFPNAQMLMQRDAVDVQTAVARGAACHALTLAAFGRGLVQPVAHDDVAIRTSTGLVPLVARGTALPVRDAEGTVRCELAVPEMVLVGTCPLRVELVAGAGDAERTIFAETWQVEGPLDKGDVIQVRCSFDENQIFEIELRLADAPGAPAFQKTIENPLTHVVNPARQARRIDEREEALRQQEIPTADVPDELVALADDYRQLHHREKALEYLKRALRMKGGSDGYILNKMGMVAGDLGDQEKEEKFYREAARAWNSTTPLFNLALAQLKRNAPRDAATTMREVLEDDPSAPSLVLAGRIAAAEDDDARRDRYFAEARKAFPKPGALDEFELHWATYLGKVLPDAEWLRACEAERRRRNGKGQTAEGADEGLLPNVRGTLVRARP